MAEHGHARDKQKVGRNVPLRTKGGESRGG